MARNAKSKEIRDSLIKASRGSFTLIHRALVETAKESASTKIDQKEVEKKLDAWVAGHER